MRLDALSFSLGDVRISASTRIIGASEFPCSRPFASEQPAEDLVNVSLLGSVWRPIVHEVLVVGL